MPLALAVAVELCSHQPTGVLPPTVGSRWTSRYVGNVSRYPNESRCHNVHIFARIHPLDGTGVVRVFDLTVHGLRLSFGFWC